MYCLSNIQEFVCRNDGREEKALLEAGEPPHSSGKWVTNSSCAHGTCLHPANCYSQRCLRCSRCWDQPGFQHWISAAPSWTLHGFAKPLWLHKWKMQRLFANLSLQQLPSKRKTVVTQDISRLAAAPAIAKWHICTARYSIYTQSCSNCESQAHNFIPQLF